ncbi:MAG: hypothetical protein V1824_00150 [archaeon]
MQTLNTWNLLFSGSYADSELNILYNDDNFVSILKSKDSKSTLLQVYKAFVADGDLDTFVETLPYQCLLFSKHYSIGDKNTYKYLLLNSELQYIDLSSLSDEVDKKLSDLNKKTSSLISITKSFNLKLISLKFALEAKNHFLSDPLITKVLSNFPLSFELSKGTTIDKFVLGIKGGISIEKTISDLSSVSVYNGALEERLFAVKLICENYLMASKQVIIFDGFDYFKSLAYPQDQKILNKFKLNMDGFGFPSKVFDYFDIKIPLYIISSSAFVFMFKFSGTSQIIIEKAYSAQLVTIMDLMKNVSNLEIEGEVTEFEKQRVLSKLYLIDKKYKDRFGETDISLLFDNSSRNISSAKILKFDSSDLLYQYYIYQIVSKISLKLKENTLFVFPECSALLNNAFVGHNLINLLKENTNINYLISSIAEIDIKQQKLSLVTINMIYDNDCVIKFPSRDPLRLFLRPTSSLTNINFRNSN